MQILEKTDQSHFFCNSFDVLYSAIEHSVNMALYKCCILLLLLLLVMQVPGKRE